MLFEKDNSVEEDLTRIVYMLYIYSLMNVKRDLWLSGQEVIMYAEMLNRVSYGEDTGKRGWVTTLKLDGLTNKAYKYIYLDRIKKKKWAIKEGGKFIFPARLIDIVKRMKGGEDVIFTIKA